MQATEVTYAYDQCQMEGQTGPLTSNAERQAFIWAVSGARPATQAMHATRAGALTRPAMRA